MKATEVETLLSNALVHDLIRVTTPDEVHFDALIVSSVFEGESRLTRQRRIYAVLGSVLQSGELHALGLKTLTPAEWQKEEQT